MTTAKPQSISGLKGKQIVAHDTDDLLDALAGDITAFALHRIREAGVFHLALSGGSTPQRLYQLLVIDPSYRQFPWEQTHLWIVDERCVPLDDDRSNYGMIQALIVDHTPIPESHVHPMPVMQSDGDHTYEQELRTQLAAAGVEDRLDYVLLGMGGDAHTASLFPESPALAERRDWVVFNDAPTIAAPRPRMTMTYPLINAARRIALLVTGESKRATLQHLRLLASDIQHAPVTGIEPTHDDAQLIWYLDQLALTENPSAT